MGVAFAPVFNELAVLADHFGNQFHGAAGIVGNVLIDRGLAGLGL